MWGLSTQLSDLPGGRKRQVVIGIRGRNSRWCHQRGSWFTTFKDLKTQKGLGQFNVQKSASKNLCLDLSVQLLSCFLLCDSVNGIMPDFLVIHYSLFLDFAQTHVLWGGDAIQPFHRSFSSWLQSFPATGSLQVRQLFASGGQRTGASASVLPMNIQDWFPLGLTCWISLQSKGLSRVFSNTTVQKHQFFSAQPFL